MTFSPGPASFIRGPKSGSPSNTRGGSRVPEWGPLGSVRGALSNERPYRDLRNVVANYHFERSHRFAGIQPNPDLIDHSRLSCGEDEHLASWIKSYLQFQSHKCSQFYPVRRANWLDCSYPSHLALHPTTWRLSASAARLPASGAGADARTVMRLRSQ